MENKMWISDIEICNFRNYELEKIKLNNKINIFYGKNAQGKTNIIEAIFLRVSLSFNIKGAAKLTKTGAI